MIKRDMSAIMIKLGDKTTFIISISLCRHGIYNVWNENKHTIRDLWFSTEYHLINLQKSVQLAVNCNWHEQLSCKNNRLF